MCARAVPGRGRKSPGLLATLLFLAFPAGLPAQPQDHLQAGITALDKGDLAAAQSNFEAAVRTAPNDARAWLLLAQAHAKRGNQASALAAAHKAEALGAQDPAILQGLANLYSGPIPDPVKAAALGARYAERKPEDRTAWRRLAAFCLATGQPDRAVEAATRGLTVDNSAELHGLLGQAYTERKEWDKAGAELAQAVKLNPYDEDTHFRLAQLYLLQQDFVTAVTVLENARKTFDKSPQIELALGVAYYGQRVFPQAVDQFLRTIRLAPDLPQPYIFLGRIMEHAGDRLPELTQRFSEFETRNPKNPLGRVLHAKGIIAQLRPEGYPPEAQAALELLQQALALQEADAEAHYLLGVVLERKGDFGSAAAHLERSIALNAKDPAPHYRLARVYARLGRADDSKRERALHEKLSESETAPDRR
jgi:tetratricopeptide (TPR) repeat protein